MFDKLWNHGHLCKLKVSVPIYLSSSLFFKFFQTNTSLNNRISYNQILRILTLLQKAFKFLNILKFNLKITLYCLNIALLINSYQNIFISKYFVLYLMFACWNSYHNKFRMKFHNHLFIINVKRRTYDNKE